MAGGRGVAQAAPRRGAARARHAAGCGDHPTAARLNMALGRSAWRAERVDEAKQHSMVEERLEVLFACATAAHRAGRAERAREVVAGATELAGEAVHWLARLEAI